MLWLFVPVKRRFQQFFSHITTVSGCDLELNAHFYGAVSLKYHGSPRYHTHSHYPDQSQLYPVGLSAKRGAASAIFNDFGMSRPVIKPVTSRSPERALYLLS